MDTAIPRTREKTPATGRGQDRLRFAALLAALLLLGIVGSSIRHGITPTQPGADEQAGAGWEGRRLIAQLLWAKTHSVLHAGAEERDSLPGEERSRAGEFHSAEAGHDDHDEHGHDEHGHVLVIPPAKDDFRGILGDLERSVKPYLGADGKMFGKSPDQTVPFYRMMTWADPHFVQGYTVGATFISEAGAQPDRGLEFLLEGEQNNPESFEIQTELGHFYTVYKKDYARAEQHLRRALSLVPPTRKLTETEEDARGDAYRWLALAYVASGKPGPAVQTAKEGLREGGNEITLRHIVEHKGRDW